MMPLRLYFEPIKKNLNNNIYPAWPDRLTKIVKKYIFKKNITWNWNNWSFFICKLCMPNVVQSNACTTDRPTNRPIVWFLMKNIQICQFWTELYLFTCYVPPPPRPTSSPIFSVVKTDLIMDYLWDHC